LTTPSTTITTIFDTTEEPPTTNGTAELTSQTKGWFYNWVRRPPSTATFKCPGFGSYPDPDDESSYYTCDTKLTPVHKTCSWFHVYDPYVRSCMPIFRFW
jgi:hypothetical protein